MFLARNVRLMLNRSIHTISEQKISVNNVAVNYTLVKSGKGEKSVLLLPGALGSSASDFKPQIEKLPNLLPNHKIYAIDLPGYGKSYPPSRKFDLDFYRTDADFSHSFMEAMNSDKYSILGWSDGGIIGMICAARTSAVEKLVIWGSNAFIVESEAKMYENIRDVSKWSKRMRDPMEQMYGAEDFEKMWHDWVDTLLRIYKERGGDICKEDVAKIDCPTLIVHGDKDPMLDSQHIDWLTKNIKRNRLFRFPDGKHNIHLRYADEFNQLVAEFLNE